MLEKIRNIVVTTIASIGMILSGSTAMVVTGAAAAGASAYHFAMPADGSDVVLTGCTVRFSGGKPWILSNAGHRSTGCDSVWVDPQGFLWVDFGITNAEECPVMTVLTQSDETLIRHGIMSGVRSGTHEAKIYFEDVYEQRMLNLARKADYDQLGNLNAANVWVGALHYRNPGTDCK